MTSASNGAEHRASLRYTVYSRFISSWGPHGDFNTILEARLQRFIEIWRKQSWRMNRRWLCYIFFLDVFVDLHIDFGKFNLSTTCTTQWSFHHFCRDARGEEGINYFSKIANELIRYWHCQEISPQGLLQWQGKHIRVLSLIASFNGNFVNLSLIGREVRPPSIYSRGFIVKLNDTQSPYTFIHIHSIDTCGHQPVLKWNLCNIV